MPVCHGLAHGLSWAKNPGGSVWVPTTPGTPLLWLDGQASSVLWQDTGATTPAASNGDPVARWDAIAGTTVTQSTSSARGARTTINSKTAVGFDDVDDRLSSAQTLSAGAKTLLVVFQHTSVPGVVEPDIVMMGGSTSAQIRLCSSGAGASAVQRLSWCFDHAGSATYVGTDGYTADSTRRVVLITYNGGAISSAGSYRCWVDGTEQTVVARTVAFSPAGTTAIGAANTGAQPFGGAIGEVVLWSGDQSAHAASAYSYANARW